MPRNFNRQLLVAIFLTAAATGSFGSDFWPVEYSFEETYVGEASVARGPHRVEDFDESDTLLRLVLTPRVKLGVLRLGFEYEQFSPAWEKTHYFRTRFNRSPRSSESILNSPIQFSLGLKLCPAFIAKLSGRDRPISTCRSKSAAPTFITPIFSL